MMKASPEDFEAAPYFTLPKTYSPRDKTGLLWNASSFDLFKIDLGSGAAYLFLRRQLREKIAGLLKECPAFAQAVRGQVLIHYAGDGTDFPDVRETVRIKILRPMQFVAGDFIFPRHAYVGKRRIYTEFNELIAASNIAEFIPPGCLWFRLLLRFGDENYPFYYTVDVKGETEKYRPFFDRLLRGLMAPSLEYLKKRLPLARAGGKMVPPPDGSALQETLIVDAGIVIGKQRIPCRVFIHTGFFSFAADRLLPEWEKVYLKKNPFSSILSVISLNGTLFMQEADEFYKRTLDQDTPAGQEAGYYGMRMSEYFNLIEDEDMRRVIHSYLIASGYTVPDMQTLFFYRYTLPDKKQGRIAEDPSFNNSRFRQMLPKVPKEDWTRLYGPARSYDELLHANSRAMEGLYGYVKKEKVSLSFRARHILDLELGQKLEEDYKDRLASLLSDSLHLSYLKRLPRGVAEQVVSAYPTNRLAAAFLSREKDADAFFPFMSRNKQSELKEELRVIRRQQTRQQLPVQQMYDELVELTHALENALMRAADLQE
jgi:hypothetical protein